MNTASYRNEFRSIMCDSRLSARQSIALTVLSRFSGSTYTRNTFVGNVKRSSRKPELSEGLRDYLSMHWDLGGAVMVETGVILSIIG